MSEGMKVTRFGDLSGTVQNTTSISGTTVIGGGSSGQVITSIGSNTANWQNNVSTITSNTSNTLLGPHVNLASGSNIHFSVTSNTLTIHALTAPVHTHSEYLRNTLGGIDVVKTISASGSATTLTLSEGNIFDVTLTAATVSFAITGQVAGSSISVIVRQDSTGGRLAAWPANITWEAGEAPTLPAGPNAYLYIVLTTPDGVTWDGFVAGGDSGSDGYYETVTNGNSSDPECVYADGDIVVAFVEN